MIRARFFGGETVGATSWSALLLLLLCGACTPPVHGACVLESAPGSMPYVRRMAALGAARIPTSKAPVCTESARGARLECEAVDDLSALTGGGFACGPGGAQPQHVCPNFAEGRVTRLAESRRPERPCGDSACPNVELVIDSGGDSESRVIFYDDPSCHGGAPELECAPARHDCYYRVLSIQTLLKGTL